MDKRINNGGSRKGAGRKPGTRHKNVTVSLPIGIVTFLRNKGKISAIVKEALEEKFKGEM